MNGKTGTDRRVTCPDCGKSVRIPADYTGRKGRCPSCKRVLDLTSLTRPAGRLAIPQNIHPAVFLTGKHRGRLQKYGDDLQQIYALIRRQFVHREEYEKQKLLLKKEAFAPIAGDAAILPDFEFALQTMIDIWQLVFTALPATYPGKEPDVVYNLYPRYDYASLICMGYVLAGYDDTRVKKLMIRKAVRGERTTPKMRELFETLLRGVYGMEFERRIYAVLKSVKMISGEAPDGMKTLYKQIEEDYNFGFSWAAFHIPS